MSDKMRSEFLEWHNGQVNMLIASGEPNAAREAQRLEPIYWCAWQASRQAVVVELPETFEKRDVQGLDYDKTVTAIEAAGVGVKP